MPTSDGRKEEIIRMIAAAKPFPPLSPEADALPRKRARKPKDENGAAKPPKASKPKDAPGKDGKGKKEAPPELDISDDYGAPPPPDEFPAFAGEGRGDLTPIEWEPQNDVGNAKRLIFHFGNEMLFVHGIGWHVWCDADGKPVIGEDPEARGLHWHSERGDQQAKLLGQLTAARIKKEKPLTKEERAIKIEAEKAAKLPPGKRTLDDEDVMAAWAEIKKGLEKTANPQGRWIKRANWSTTTGNTGKINGMLDQAEPHKIIDVKELDTDPYAFNVLNGTLRFYAEPDEDDVDDTGRAPRLKWKVRLDPHRREDMIARVAPVAYDPDAICPEWRKFLMRVQPEHEMRRFLRDWYGYNLLGLTDAQAFVFHWGGGANGKSTLIECLFRIFGPYGGSLNPESVTGTQQRRGDQATPDLVDLVNVRALRVSELPERQQLQDNLIKAVTGGEVIKVRQLQQPFIEFRPVFKPSMSGNARPEIKDISEGMWRRLALVPWTVMIPKEERKSFGEMQRIFEAEWSGILNWLVAGAISFLDAGRFVLPEQVLAATEAHREEMNPVGEFLKACVDRMEGVHEQAGNLYRVYLAWCDDSGERAVTATKFGRDVTKHGWGNAKMNGGVRHYIDMKLKFDAPAPRAPKGEML